MVNFKICLRKANKAGYWPVYIRVINNRHVGYIKTPWVENKQGIAKNGDVKDPFVLENCSIRITEFVRRINGIDTSSWDFDRLKSFLTGRDGEYTFSAYARKYISRMENLGHNGNARLYKAALASLERYLGTDAIKFDDIRKETIEGWIATLGNTRRAKSLYPISIRVIFKDAFEASAAPSSPLPRLSYNPWNNISIPVSEPIGKRSIGVEECRRFFNVKIPQKTGTWPERLGLDMALLSFCLAGINTVDIFNLKKEDFDGHVISYKRTKTKTRRKDGAYFEINVNDMAAKIIRKYRADEDYTHLLNLHERYNDARSFNAMVNVGIRRICKNRLKLKEEQVYSFYSFRHTWATIAQNVCGASLSEIGFAMNHLQNHAVTRDYIDIDFSPAWALNQRVWDVVFGEQGYEETVLQKASADTADSFVQPGSMVYARAYFRGEVLAEVSDIGFGNVDEVISRFAGKLPDTIPTGCAVQFRIKDVDAGREAVYERTKGKGV